MNALKTILFTVLVPATIAVYLPWLLFWRSAMPYTGRLQYIAWPVIVTGAFIYLSCALDFVIAGRGTPAPIDPPKDLVVQGLYRYVRNPMYVGVGLVLLGEAAWFGSPNILIYCMCFWLATHLFVVLYEERTLTRRFGESYQRYCEAVPRWIPRIRRHAVRA